MLEDREPDQICSACHSAFLTRMTSPGGHVGLRIINAEIRAFNTWILVLSPGVKENNESTHKKKFINAL